MDNTQQANEQANDILQFWFGALDANGFCCEDKNKLWFGAAAEDDRTLQQRFGSLVAAAINGELAHWQEHDNTQMALLLLCDQMTRAIYRSTPQAFAGDAIALASCKSGIADGRHRKLPAAWRRFYYLPLEHSENLDDQQHCVALYQQLVDDYPQHKTSLAENVRYAEQHRVIIAQFGRFPHRNRILQRDSTAAEIAYLTDGGQNFGQA